MLSLLWRVVLVLSLSAASLLAAAAGPASAQAMRKSINALSPAELMALRRGVATMMARNTAPRGSADFRRSWVYWANMHGHFGSTCAGPITGSGMAGVQLWQASNATETETWCKCEHHTDQFLTWHRMYLYYFEQVLRQASGSATLNLPYWDYATDRKLPAALRAQTYVNENGQTVPNPLRVAARRSALNSGTSSLSATAVSSANAMSATTRATFATRLESTPHGAVHCAIASSGCPTGLMGKVPSAALDPVFYLHHANIDRLYECWLKVNEAARLPTAASVLNRQYSFIDGAGNPQQRRVGDMLTTAVLGYGYTAGAGCPAPAAPPALVVAEAGTEMPQGRMAPMATQGGFEIGRGSTEVPVEVEATGGARTTAAGAGSLRAAVVTVEGLTATVEPGVLYNVYLANAAGRREQIGVIDFFDFGGETGSGGRHAGHGAAPRNYDFDATEAVRALGLGPSRQPILIFEPTTGLDDSTPAAASREIAPNATVAFRRARLRLER